MPNDQQLLTISNSVQLSKDFIKLEEATKITGLSQQSLETLVNSDVFTAVRVDGVSYISRRFLEDYGVSSISKLAKNLMLSEDAIQKLITSAKKNTIEFRSSTYYVYEILNSQECFLTLKPLKPLESKTKELSKNELQDAYVLYAQNDNKNLEAIARSFGVPASYLMRILIAYEFLPFGRPRNVHVENCLSRAGIKNWRNYLTAPEVAARLKIDEYTLTTCLREENHPLKGIKVPIGRRSYWFISIDSLNGYLGKYKNERLYRIKDLMQIFDRSADDVRQKLSRCNATKFTVREHIHLYALSEVTPHLEVGIKL